MITIVALLLMAGLTAAVPALTRRWGRDAGYPLAAGYLVTGAVVATQVPYVADGAAVTVAWRWLPSLDASFALRLDGLAMVFALLVLGVGALIMGYCPRYLDEGPRHTRTYLLLTLFATGMLGLVMAADLLVLLVFWELTTVCSFFLIGGSGRAAARPATRALAVTAGGGLALLAAVVLMTAAAGTSDLAVILSNPDLVTDSPAAWAVGALVAIAAFTKSAQFPFHFWLPGAMAAITPVSAYLHAATMVKAGIYLLMRFTPLFAGEPVWTVTLVGVGLVTAVLGAFLALRQHDLKALLAYSTVSQRGLLVAAVGVGTAGALTAAILHTVAHALFKATLFMLVGIIDREAGSRDIRQLSGLRHVMPVTATLTALAAMSMAGLPPLVGFVSKEELFEAFLDLPTLGWLAGAVAVTASVLTVAYSARIVYGAFAGPNSQPGLYEPTPAFLAPAATAAVLGTALGPAVAALNPLVISAAADTRTGGEPPQLYFWHGLTPALWMSVAAVVAGTLLFLGRERTERLVQSAPLPPPGSALYDQGYDGLLRLGARVGRPARTDAPAAYLWRPILALVVLGGIGIMVVDTVPPAAASARPGDWAVTALLAAALATTVATRSVLALVALLGITGLVVAVWFVLAGAPDVALTLVLVEVLTAVVAMLVLRRLPEASLRRRRTVHSATAAVLAVAAGTVAGLGTWFLTGRRELSRAGEYFLRSAEPETGGTNVVNTILVDFRGLDTLGEATVLAAVALGLLALTGGRAARIGQAPGRRVPAGDGAGRDVVLGVAHRLLAPVMLVVSAYLFLRGHDEPGGGFIAALVAGIAVALAHLAHPTGGGAAWRPAVRPLLTAGLLLSLGVGLAAPAAGEPFLTPLRLPLPGDGYLSTALVFDLGIYLMVLALVVAAVSRLGVGTNRVEEAYR
ncbi:MAG TPA: hydrogen gas-evolving membrane-bound hydrogenase subunit E [Actinoplanes sp.]|nr:hydrogen gas-evolving membrane-bound hydrogenase subunit E [Actinoplanes sp.]